jgi:galactokinase
MLGGASAVACFQQHYGSGLEPAVLFVPGRVNLIGEHIDYHNLPVLPMAIQRGVWIAFRPRHDSRISAVSAQVEGTCRFPWVEKLEPGPPGDWCNYLKAAAQAIAGKWGVLRGIDAAVSGDLPPAAGLSSSSALLTGMTLALLRANSIHATFEELMEVLPEGEYFVGTRGGGMDHAAVLAGRAGSALLVEFAPVAVKPVPIPEGWSFLVVHSGSMAEKSSAVKAEFNARRAAGQRALERLGLQSFREAKRENGPAPDSEEAPVFEHVIGEAERVRDAVETIRKGDAQRFGRLLLASHASLRDLLRVSTPALDRIVSDAMAAGAMGARLTGAGFGGCAIVFCMEPDREQVRRAFGERMVIDAEPSAGALFA